MKNTEDGDKRPLKDNRVMIQADRELYLIGYRYSLNHKLEDVRVKES